MLGFAGLREGDVEMTPEGRKLRRSRYPAAKQFFREAALKNIAILRLIENALHAKRNTPSGRNFSATFSMSTSARMKSSASSRRP